MTTPEPAEPWTCPECHLTEHADGCFLALIEDAFAAEDEDPCGDDADWEWAP